MKSFLYHSFFGRISEPAVQLADKLIEISPFNSGKVFLQTLVQKLMIQQLNFYGLLIVVKENPIEENNYSHQLYHGTAVSASMTGKPYNSEFGLPLEGFLHAACPHYWNILSKMKVKKNLQNEWVKI